MKNNKRLAVILLLSIALCIPAFEAMPGAKAFALNSFTISPDPSGSPLYAGHVYYFTLNATLPGNSGSNGVNVYLTPAPGYYPQYGGIAIDYSPAYNPAEIKIAPNQNSGIATMMITVDSNATSSQQILTVNAYDNPGGGGNIIGFFRVTLHVNEVPLTVQTTGLNSASYPTKVYLGGIQVGTAYDASQFTQWLQIDTSTGTATTPIIGVDAIVPGSSGTQNFFIDWSDGIADSTHASITISDPTTLTANYQTATTQVTITSDPAGSGFVNVDGIAFDTPHTFTLAIGSTHNIEAVSAVQGASGTQYVFTSWSDGGGQTHDYVTPSSPATVIAGFKTQYLIDFVVNPTDAGSTVPSGTNVWQDAGSPTVSAIPNEGYNFSSWTSVGSITFSSSISAITEASINGPGIITAHFAPNPVTHFGIVASPSSIVAGASVSVSVTALDQFDNVVTAYSGVAHFNSSDSQAILPADSALTYGIGSFSVILATAGSQTITAADLVTGATGISNAVLVIAGDSNTVTHFDVVASPSSVIAGGSIVASVTALDQFGNMVTAYSGTVHFTSSDGQAALPIDSALSDGFGTFNITLVTVGSQIVTVIDTVTGSTGTSNDVSVTAGQLSSIIISPKSATIVAGSSQAFFVTAYDQYGNNLGDVTGSATLNALGASVSGNLVSATSVGSYMITASYNGKTDAANLTVIPAGVDKIKISPTSSNINAGSFQSYSVEAFDQFGNDLGDVTALSTFSVNGLQTTGNIIFESNPGYYLVVASYSGKTASATLIVFGVQTNTVSQPTYNVVFTESGLPSGQSWSVTFNGKTVSSKTSAIAFTIIGSGGYSWSTQRTLSGAAGKQYVPSVASGMVNVPSTKSISISYTTQYYLTVVSSFGNATGQGWYNAGSKATFGVNSSVTDKSGNLIEFTSWNGTGTGSYTGPGNNQSVTMNNPITESANWKTVVSTTLSTIVEAALILLALLLLAILLLAARRRRKNKNSQNKSVQP